MNAITPTKNALPRRGTGNTMQPCPFGKPDSIETELDALVQDAIQYLHDEGCEAMATAIETIRYRYGQSKELPHTSG